MVLTYCPQMTSEFYGYGKVLITTIDYCQLSLLSPIFCWVLFCKILTHMAFSSILTFSLVANSRGAPINARSISRPLGSSLDPLQIGFNKYHFLYACTKLAFQFLIERKLKSSIGDSSWCNRQTLHRAHL